MIIIDAKIFETGQVFNLLVDEDASVADMLLKLSYADDTDSGTCYAVSELTKRFLSRTKSFKSQGVKGGDRLILIRHDK